MKLGIQRITKYRHRKGEEKNSCSINSILQILGLIHQPVPRLKFSNNLWGGGGYGKKENEIQEKVD